MNYREASAVKACKPPPKRVRQTNMDMQKQKTVPASSENSISASYVRVDEVLALIESIYFVETKRDAAAVEENETNSRATATTNESTTDVAEFELHKLNLVKFDVAAVSATLARLEQQRDAIGRRVSEIILKNSQAYSQELQRISDLKLLVQDCHQLCGMSRRSILMSNLVSIKPALSLVRKQAKKLCLVKLLKIIQAVKHFQNTNAQITQLIQAKEFPQAIAKCKLNEAAMDQYAHLKCVKSLKSSQKDYYTAIDECLDASVCRLCRHFDAAMYEKCMLTYFMLNKCDHLFQKMSKHFLSAVHSACSDTLVNFLIRTNNNNNNNNTYLAELKRLDYADLIKLIDSDSYKNCLVEMSCNMWTIVKNYYKACTWLAPPASSSSDHAPQTVANEEVVSTSPPSDSATSFANETNAIPHELIKELQQKLIMTTNCIWQEIQIKISMFFRAMQFDNFKFDDFIDILTVINRLIEIGEEFCNKNSDSLILIKTTRDQTLAYFKAFHVSRLEEMRMFLENETFCPIVGKFATFELQEYKFLKVKNSSTVIAQANLVLFKEFYTAQMSSSAPSVKKPATTTSEHSTCASTDYDDDVDDENERNGHDASNDGDGHDDDDNDDDDDDSITDSSSSATTTSTSTHQLAQANTFMRSLLDMDNPFEKISSSSSSSDGRRTASTSNASMNDSISDDQQQSPPLQHQQAQPSIQHESPVLINTSLNIIRLFGKYIHMLSIFQIISQEVIAYLMQLFYFYVYYLYYHFVYPELELSGSDPASSSSIQSIMRTIKAELFSQTLNFAEPHISAMRKMHTRQDYFDSIHQRVIASESLIFLSKQLEELVPLILNYLPENVNNASLQAYLHVIEDTPPKMQRAMYAHISRVAINYALIGEQVARVNWDLHDILSQHNRYVDLLLEQMDQLAHDVRNAQLHDKCLEKRAVDLLLELCLRATMRMLVDAYASVKRCTNEGRALMQLDFQQLVVKVDKSYEIRPVPDRDLVDNYIKAYYLPDSSIEQWIREHPEYSKAQVTSLINIMAQLTKKTRVTLISSLENGFYN